MVAGCESLGRLALVDDPQGVSADWLLACTPEVGPAGSAERLRRRADGPSRTLKNLWQEAGVPAWLRRALPAVRVEGRLLAAEPFGMDRGAAWPRGGRRVAVCWRPDDPADPRASWTSGAVGTDG